MSNQPPRIRLSRNGPLLVAVEDLMNSKGERLQAWHGVALCRCGASARKPFCDASHIRIGFSDEPRADRAPDCGGPDAGNAPGIRMAQDGPYEVRNIELDDEAWRKGGSPARYELCRCGGSKSKPFCDGTHERTGFRDDRG